MDFLGNCTLALESTLCSLGRVYDRGSLSTSLLCRIPTTTVLDIPSQTVFEESETISISTELLSLNSTPITHENLTFMIFRDQEMKPIEVILDQTNDQGICRISIKAPMPGTLTIVAIFNGSLLLNSSSDVYSITVLPKFQERLPSYLIPAALACLPAATMILIARRAKRKLKWRNLTVSRSLE
jgi:hypothetical protein